MKLSYNVTGQKRKELVGIVSEALNAPVKYLGAPTFAYKIDSYRIDRDGMLTGPDNRDLEDALFQQGFETAEREYDVPDTYESGLGGIDATPSFEDLDMTEEEELGLGKKRREDSHGENGMSADDFPDIDQRHPGQYADPNTPYNPTMLKQADEWYQGELDRMAIEVPLTGFTPEKIDNLIKLINAKAPLLKAALGVVELPIRQSDADGGKLRFPWFIGMIDSDTANAYTLLIEKLCAAAKNKTRITAREREVDNPKYAMRCWLLSLGFIGDDYRQARKILLQSLHGNGAYKSTAKQGAEVGDDVSE